MSEAVELNGFTIEENIPVNGTKSVIIPMIAKTLLDIKPKQSFLVGNSQFDVKVNPTSVRTSLKTQLAGIQPPDFSFSLRKEKNVDGEVLGIRFWRVS